MSAQVEPEEVTTVLSNGVRTALGVSGIVAVVLGILILISPLKTASVITAIIALYAAVSGVIYLSIGIFSKRLGSGKRVLQVIVGLVFLALGVIAFMNLGGTTTLIATFVALMIGIAWVVEGVMALSTVRYAKNRVWVIVFAAINVIAGIIVMIAPFSFAALLWLILGISLIILGGVQILRAFTFDAAKVIANV